MRAALEIDPENLAALSQMGSFARSVGDDETALLWFQRAAAVRAPDAGSLFEVAVSLADLQRSTESEEVMSRVAALPGAFENERLRIRRFEYYCSSLRLETALAVLKEFDPQQPLPAKAVPLAAALHAWRSDWDTVLQLFAERVVHYRGPDRVQPKEALTESVGRAARALSQQADTIALLERWEAASTPLAVALRDQLAEELQLLHALNPSIPAPTTAIESPLRGERVSRMAALLAPKAATPTGTILLCSDLAYLPGAMTTLSSLLRNNRATLRNCRFVVFLSDDAMSQAKPMIERLDRHTQGDN